MNGCDRGNGANGGTPTGGNETSGAPSGSVSARTELPQSPYGRSGLDLSGVSSGYSGSIVNGGAAANTVEATTQTDHPITMLQNHATDEHIGPKEGDENIQTFDAGAAKKEDETARDAAYSDDTNRTVSTDDKDDLGAAIADDATDDATIEAYPNTKVTQRISKHQQPTMQQRLDAAKYFISFLPLRRPKQKRQKTTTTTTSSPADREKSSVTVVSRKRAEKHHHQGQTVINRPAKVPTNRCSRQDRHMQRLAREQRARTVQLGDDSNEPGRAVKEVDESKDFEPEERTGLGENEPDTFESCLDVEEEGITSADTEKDQQFVTDLAMYSVATQGDGGSNLRVKAAVLMTSTDNAEMEMEEKSPRSRHELEAVAVLQNRTSTTKLTVKSIPTSKDRMHSATKTNARSNTLSSKEAVIATTKRDHHSVAEQLKAPHSEEMNDKDGAINAIVTSKGGQSPLQSGSTKSRHQ